MLQPPYDVPVKKQNVEKALATEMNTRWLFYDNTNLPSLTLDFSYIKLLIILYKALDFPILEL